MILLFAFCINRHCTDHEIIYKWKKKNFNCLCYNLPRAAQNCDGFWFGFIVDVHAIGYERADRSASWTRDAIKWECSVSVRSHSSHCQLSASSNWIVIAFLLRFRSPFRHTCELYSYHASLQCSLSVHLRISIWWVFAVRHIYKIETACISLSVYGTVCRAVHLLLCVLLGNWIPFFIHRILLLRILKQFDSSFFDFTKKKIEFAKE